jgi:hypothetical protein
VDVSSRLCVWLASLCLQVFTQNVNRSEANDDGDAYIVEAGASVLEVVAGILSQAVLTLAPSTSPAGSSRLRRLSSSGESYLDVVGEAYGAVTSVSAEMLRDALPGEYPVVTEGGTSLTCSA